MDFDKIRKKVEDAGFSVSGFVATIYFDNVQLKADQPVTIGNHTLLFEGLKDRSLNGAKQVKFLDKGFVSPKEYKSTAGPGSLTRAGTYRVTL